MARRAYATDAFACDRGLKKSLIEGMAPDDRPFLEEIIARADALVAAQRDPDPAVLVLAIEDLRNFCAGLDRCLPWVPEDRTRHIIVRIYGLGDRVISVTRAMWARYHVVSAQGPQLRADEELHHTCRMNGQAGTGYGACLNPAHFIRGNQEFRFDWQAARKTYDEAAGRAGL